MELHGDTYIRFTNGKHYTIKQIAQEHLTGPVMTYNDVFIEKPIISWQNLGTINDKWLTCTFSSPNQLNGKSTITCSKSTEILTNNGYKRIEDITINDKLVSYYYNFLDSNQLYKEIIIGSLLGDGAITKSSLCTCRLELTNSEQSDYLQWKIDQLRNLEFTSSKKNNGMKYTSKSIVDLKEIYDLFYKNKKRIIPDIKLTPLSAAIWFMDDGTLNNTTGVIARRRLLKYDNKEQQIYQGKKLLSDFIGYNINKIKFYKQGYFAINKNELHIFCDRIKNYVIPSMQYKLLPEYRNSYKDFDSNNLKNYVIKNYLSDVISVDISPRNQRSKKIYSIYVENNADILIGGGNGVIVKEGNV